MTCMRFFAKRFSYIGRNVESMSAVEDAEPIDNQRLARLISDYNKIQLDLILINDFFSFYLGFNLISFFAFGLTGVFAGLLDIDWRLVKYSKPWIHLEMLYEFKDHKNS